MFSWHLSCWSVILIKGLGLGLFNNTSEAGMKNIRQGGTIVANMHFLIFNGICCLAEEALSTFAILTEIYIYFLIQCDFSK